MQHNSANMLPDRRSRRAVCRAFVPAKNGGTITWRGGHAGQANEPSRRSSAMNPRARRRVACLGPRCSNMRGGRDCESDCMFTSAASSTAETAASAPVIATTAAPSTRCRRRRPALEIANKAGPSRRGRSGAVAQVGWNEASCGLLAVLPICHYMLYGRRMRTARPWLRQAERGTRSCPIKLRPAACMMFEIRDQKHPIAGQFLRLRDADQRRSAERHLAEPPLPSRSRPEARMTRTSRSGASRRRQVSRLLPSDHQTYMHCACFRGSSTILQARAQMAST